MYSPISNTWNVKSPILWVDFAISLIAAVLLFLVVNKIAQRKAFTIIGSVSITVCFIAWFFGMNILWTLSLLFLVANLTSFFVKNQTEVQNVLPTMFHFQRKGSIKVYDRHAVCQKVALAVETLSKTKTGALITFEKGVSLDDTVKTGTILHSPVTPELLTTIFYPGTRLHDGAVVIRRDEILAASVYYTPTTKPLTGKFGSRHRAAIGISESTDSVTVVVSEETGRVSIATNGELNPVAPDRILSSLEEFVFNEAKTSEEKE